MRVFTRTVGLTPDRRALLAVLKYLRRCSYMKLRDQEPGGIHFYKGSIIQAMKKKRISKHQTEVAISLFLQDKKVDFDEIRDLDRVESFIFNGDLDDLENLIEELENEIKNMK